jgi:hypothetical protein
MARILGCMEGVFRELTRRQDNSTTQEVNGHLLKMGLFLASHPIYGPLPLASVGVYLAMQDLGFLSMRRSRS